MASAQFHALAYWMPTRTWVRHPFSQAVWTVQAAEISSCVHRCGDSSTLLLQNVIRRGQGRGSLRMAKLGVWPNPVTSGLAHGNRMSVSVTRVRPRSRLIEDERDRRGTSEDNWAQVSPCAGVYSSCQWKHPSSSDFFRTQCLHVHEMPRVGRTYAFAGDHPLTRNSA
ncbi:hypothetical protein L226DRAFT_93881 [Lentinus tigrinus ALCF2SS1-7]|uniref:Uncharacterized protein n=1 Tax=Lentinus tigrinus ALCF2SS1-6 TaxID=1328759 RepID=A0A5C2RYD0_9APHY|nr:hypothetical protein L227DRAFT_285688 [Lentinus tigrinus ALCF2SS1-6]RPD74052.1 hypothetical protein L226DRAFT_93881 [Lentinus tigrinus ALCF2SS1-7]